MTIYCKSVKKKRVDTNQITSQMNKNSTTKKQYQGIPSSKGRSHSLSNLLGHF